MPSQRSERAKDNDDKAQDSMDSFMETAEKLYSLPLEKAARKVDIFSDSIDLLDKKLANAVGSNAKNKIIDKQKTQEKNTLNAYKTAKTESKKSLNSAKKELKKNKNLNADDGITKRERQKIKSAANKNQEVNLSFFKEGTAGYKAAVKYNEALKANKKAIDDAAAAQEDYNRYLVESAKQKFDNVVDDYNKKVQMIGYEMSALDDRISEIEASGRKVHKSYYEDQKAVNQKKLDQYKAEKAALEESLKGIKRGTDEWYDAYDQIQQVSSSISECTKETYELNDAISQLHFDMVDDTTEGIRRIITEQEFLRGLFAHEKNTDKKTGGLTDAGLANLGSLSVGYHASKENASRLAAEVAELQRMLDAGETYSSLLGIELNSIDNVEERLNEARATEQEWVKERYDNASAIHGIMEELYNAELDYLKELVDAKKEALDAEKDLHDYQKAISEKTEGIAAIQKQIAAYSGDTSEEGRAKLQRLQKELDDRNDDLKETEYDRYVSDQKDMLDSLYDEYSKKVEEKIEDFMALVQEGLDKADDNMSGIRDFLGEIASRNGYETATKGLFDSTAVLNASNGTTSTTGIGDNARDAASQVADNEKEKYESTKPAVFPDAQLIEDTKAYIRTSAIKAKKKKNEYSDVSQKIYENKAKSYEGTGKVLATSSMMRLASLLGVKYDNASKSGRLYKKLKSIKFPGFRKGGVVSVEDIEKQVRANGDTSLVSAQNGEGFVEKEHVKPIKELVESVPEINKLAKALSDTPKTDGIIRTPDGIELVPVPQGGLIKSLSLKNVPNVDIPNALKNMAPDFASIVKPSLPSIQSVKNATTTTNIDIGGITMNGVNDPAEFSRQIVNSIQNYPKVRKAIHASSTDILSGSGRFYADRVLK